MTQFPQTLYKKTSTGAIQFWTIDIDVCSYPPYSYKIVTTFGQLNTDKPQVTTEIVTSGKNLGKKNETTTEQQAILEAKAKWEAKQKSGYVQSLEMLEAGEVSDLIKGGISPMLAHKFSEHATKIVYPAFVQPKLDGIRCIAIVKDGSCTLWTRTRKPINSVPHIQREIERVFKDDIILDGELYNHEYRNNFEHIASLVGKAEPREGHELVQYHIYDLINDNVFRDRSTVIFNISESFNEGPLKRIPTILISEEDVAYEFNYWINEGYEGVMIRNADSLYEHKRSYHLQKVKEFDTDEFLIIDIEEGKGRLAGHVGSFKCQTEDGKEFFVKLSGDTLRLKNCFEDHGLWQGKKLTVQYQGLTGANGVPRFPIGVAIRDYE